MELVAEKYKQTEVGLIPSDWDIDYIKNLAVIKTGSRNTQDRIENGLYPFFVRSQTVERINSYSFDGEAVLTAGDGVGVGKVIHYVNEKFDCHQRVYRISDFSEKLNGYYFYLYFSNNFLNRIMQMTAKSSVDSVRMDMIANMQIPIPPTKAEQTSIATALSDVDALIRSLEKLIAKKRNIKQGAMQKLLQPKEGWEVKKLGDSADIFRGGSPRPIESFLTIQPDGINWIKIGDVKKNAKYIESTDEKIISEGLSRSRFVDEGDFLLSNSMSFGRPYIMKISGCIHDGWLVIQNYQNNFDRDFLYYVLGSEAILQQYKAMASGSSVLNLNKEIVKNVIINCPKSVEEQTRIATILSDMDAEINALESKLEKYRKIKLGMMQNLLTGKIRLV